MTNKKDSPVSSSEGGDDPMAWAYSVEEYGPHVSLDKPEASPKVTDLLPLYARPEPSLRGDEAEWIKACTAKISNAIGGGSELFVRHGEVFRLDVDFVCKRISEMRERQHNAMHRAIVAERALASATEMEGE